jgi:iron complex outermembrane receptor protein
MALAIAACLAAGAADANGQGNVAARDLTQSSVEDLMNIEITSAGRKQERLADTPAAVYVITSEDIRRSGMTTVPELLRLVPGVQVAQINSNKWAVSVRGFDDLFSDKLLVMIDGRTAYDRLNSGVFWESLDVPLDQIERIEVIRGPGGATWGANAMNGVISIITKTAVETPGVALVVGLGTFDGSHASARYGGAVRGVAYRLSSQWSGRGESQLDPLTRAGDGWASQNHAVRADWTRGAEAVMVQGGATLATLHGLWSTPAGPVPAVKPLDDGEEATREYDVLGRWIHTRASGASLQVQSFVDFRHNDDSVNPRQTQIDLDAQYHTLISTRQDLVIGGGYRHLRERVPGGFTFSISPAQVDEAVVNAFAQDEIALTTRVRVTLGAKLERDPYVGWGVQPTARVMWSAGHGQQAWAAASRAVRTPSLGEISGRFNFASFIGAGGVPVVVGALGNPEFHSEGVIDTEAGYRVPIGAGASVDVTAFRGLYDHLKTGEPLAPRFEQTPAPAHVLVPIQFGNLLAATTLGVEIAAHLTPMAWWRIDAGYSTFHLATKLSPLSGDESAAASDGAAPRAQWQAHSGMSLPHRLQLDAMLFHSGVLRGFGIPAYTRADLRMEVPLHARLFTSVVGQNLLDPSHPEFGRALVTPTLVPRSARVQLAWRY